MVAKKYQNSERIGEPFEKNGRLYTKIKTICPRCGGLGIIAARVENDHIVPIPVANGICFQCEGNKYIYDEVRLYTEKEYNMMEKAKATAAEKREAARIQKMKEEWEDNKREWLKTNGWSEEGITYIITGESYSIKDELKENGFKYDTVLGWHKSFKDSRYEDRLLEINLDDVVDISAWGKGSYKIEAKDFIKNKLAETQPKSTSEWIGEVGEKIKDIKVQLVKKYSFDTRYGLSTAFTFQTEEGNVLVWFTSTFPAHEVGDWVIIAIATIKKLDEYKETKQTIITRPRFKEEN